MGKTAPDTKQSRYITVKLKQFQILEKQKWTLCFNYSTEFNSKCTDTSHCMLVVAQEFGQGGVLRTCFSDSNLVTLSRKPHQRVSPVKEKQVPPGETGILEN